MDKLWVSHEEYESLCDRVISSVLDGAWRPDAVLGVSRGGLWLADALSRALKVPMAVVAARSYCGAAGSTQGCLTISASVATVEPLAGRLLLVDDLVDSGATMKALVDWVPLHLPGVSELKTAVVWVKPHALFEPDFCAARLTDNPWIVQPLERRDFAPD